MTDASSWIHRPLSWMAGMLSPRGRRARLTILIFHRVLDAPDPMLAGELDRDAFDWQMGLLVKHFTVLPLREACERLREGSLPARAACVTFDDGYADNEALALPILQRYGLSASFFVATEFLDGGRMWNDSVIEWARRIEVDEVDLSDFGLGVVHPSDVAARRELARGIIGAIKYLEPGHRSDRVASLVERVAVKLPDNLMMTSAQVRHLAQAGMEIGGHTHSHPILASLDEVQAKREIETGKEKLEQIIEAPLRLFAYPNGKPNKDYRLRDRNLVQSLGFEAAVSTHWGAADRTSDPYQLPRFTPWHGNASRYHLALLRNFFVRDRKRAAT